MRLPELRQIQNVTTTTLGDYLRDLATPTVRLGVTGLSQAGKTVFITALVRNLTEGGRLPFFSAFAERRVRAAYLEPQPDDDVPRFAYEQHVAALTTLPPEWPRSTRQISQLRVTIEATPRSALTSFIGIQKMHIDIVDYPGEWLLDLSLMETSHEEWSAAILERARRKDHAAVAAPLLSCIAELDPAGPYDEANAQRLAELFRVYLTAARRLPPGLATLGPGRFLMPGDLDGSPLLTFGPLDFANSTPGGALSQRTLGGALARRFESYKLKVVQPFFESHFARIDRQIVLVDALSALNGGRDTLTDLRQAIEAALKAFRPGTNTWLRRLLGRRRIDKILFAATKADHIPQSSHERLSDILRLLTNEAIARAEESGAEIGTIAVAALRATRETTAMVDGAPLSCIRGTPMPGERIGNEVFDGTQEAAVFPGDLPEDAEAALAAAEQNAFEDVTFLRFRPPKLEGTDGAGQCKPWPHIRLDRALEFLVGDRLP